MMPDPARLRDFARRYTAAWKSQNAASVAACFAPTGSLSVNALRPSDAARSVTDERRCATWHREALPDAIVATAVTAQVRAVVARVRIGGVH